MATSSKPERHDARSALVTGAGGWLGGAIAEGLADAGYRVWLAGRRPKPLQELETRLLARGLDVRVQILDVGDRASIASAVEQMRATGCVLSALVNNAHPGLDVDAGDTSVAKVGRAAVSAWELSQSCLDLLDASVQRFGDASIINVASMYGKVSPYPSLYESTDMPANPWQYGAAKASLLQLTRRMACELGPRGIRVNSLSPGPFPQWDLPAKAPQFTEQLALRTPLGRTGHRAEIAGPVLFLAGPAATYVTGADLAVDGGWTAW